MNLSDPVTAALIGASPTFATALFQLLVNARRQAAERAAGKPVSRKSGTWLAIFALMLAAAVGGYAFAQYQIFRDREDDKVLRQEMQTRLRDIGDAAERRRGAGGVAAVIGLPPCVNSQSAPESSAGCNEGNALHVSVCAIIPATAVVTEVQVFTRLEDSLQPWPEARVRPGQDAGSAKFVDAFYERTQADAKGVCQRFVHWNSQKARLARILVKYAL
jgi:hypothetical protein